MYFAIKRSFHEDDIFVPAAKRMFQPAYSLDLEQFLNPAIVLASFAKCDRRDKCQQISNFQNDTYGKNKNSVFEVKVNVEDYKPEELEVKTENNYVIITGKHEEKQDEYVLVSWQFSRRYALPPGSTPDTITCKLSSDGFLVVSAPIQNSSENDRKIPITLCDHPMELNPSYSTTLQEKVINAQNSQN